MSQTAPPENGSTPARSSRMLRVVFFAATAGLIVAGVAAIFIYTSSLGSKRWAAFSGAIMVAGASVLVGALLGFTFGIPRSESTNTGVTAQPESLRANTNLEQVSDWLTKILIGVGLVQIRSLASEFRSLTRTVAPVLGSTAPEAEVMAGAMMTYGLIFGFLAAYISARTIVVLAFSPHPDRRGSR